MYISIKEVDEEFHLYILILIDKNETQVNGSEIRLSKCLKEYPCDEIYVEKARTFCQSEQPDYYGFPKGKHFAKIYMVFHNI
jgi:hypothetical protein